LASFWPDLAVAPVAFFGPTVALRSGFLRGRSISGGYSEVLSMQIHLGIFDAAGKYRFFISKTSSIASPFVA
jgi:hypothetical protein